jgi:hypothetical protein
MAPKGKVKSAEEVAKEKFDFDFRDAIAAFALKHILIFEQQKKMTGGKKSRNKPPKYPWFQIVKDKFPKLLLYRSESAAYGIVSAWAGRLRLRSPTGHQNVFDLRGKESAAGLEKTDEFAEFLRINYFNKGRVLQHSLVLEQYKKFFNERYDNMYDNDLSQKFTFGDSWYKRFIKKYFQNRRVNLNVEFSDEKIGDESLEMEIEDNDVEGEEEDEERGKEDKEGEERGEGWGEEKDEGELAKSLVDVECEDFVGQEDDGYFEDAVNVEETNSECVYEEVELEGVIGAGSVSTDDHGDRRGGFCPFKRGGELAGGLFGYGVFNCDGDGFRAVVDESYNDGLTSPLIPVAAPTVPRWKDQPFSNSYRHGDQEDSEDDDSDEEDLLNGDNSGDYYDNGEYWTEFLSKDLEKAVFSMTLAVSEIHADAPVACEKKRTRVMFANDVDIREFSPTSPVTAHAAPESVTAHTAPRSETEHAAPRSETEHAAPRSETEHAAPRSETEHAAPGSVTTHAAPGSVTTHAAPGSVTAHTAPGSVTTNTAPRSVTANNAPFTYLEAVSFVCDMVKVGDKRLEDRLSANSTRLNDEEILGYLLTKSRVFADGQNRTTGDYIEYTEVHRLSFNGSAEAYFTPVCVSTRANGVIRIGPEDGCSTPVFTISNSGTNGLRLEAKGDFKLKYVPCGNKSLCVKNISSLKGQFLRDKDIWTVEDLPGQFCRKETFSFVDVLVVQLDKALKMGSARVCRVSDCDEMDLEEKKQKVLAGGAVAQELQLADKTLTPVRELFRQDKTRLKVGQLVSVDGVRERGVYMSPPVRPSREATSKGVNGPIRALQFERVKGDLSTPFRNEPMRCNFGRICGSYGSFERCAYTETTTCDIVVTDKTVKIYLGNGLLQMIQAKSGCCLRLRQLRSEDDMVIRLIGKDEQVKRAAAITRDLVLFGRARVSALADIVERKKRN